MSLLGKTKVKERLIGNIHVLKQIDGYSAYELAVKHGFEGTEKEWLESLKGKDGANGVGIFQINNYPSSEDDGYNVMEVTLTDGTQTLFPYKNGSKGDPGTLENHSGIDALNFRITNVADPIEDDDAVNKKYLAERFAAPTQVDAGDAVEPGYYVGLIDIAYAGSTYHMALPLFYYDATSVGDEYGGVVIGLAENINVIIFENGGIDWMLSGGNEGQITGRGTLYLHKVM